MGIVGTKYGRMRIIESDAVVSKSLRLYGEWADDELSFLQALLEPGMSVFDVGAFIGTHTLAFASFCGSQGTVTSFEPRREIFDVLAANVVLNGCTNVTVNNLGLAEKAFELTLGALNLDDASNFGGLALEGVGPTPTVASYQTSVVTLDSLKPERLDLIKLDVEGMEAQVLAGAAATIERCRPMVFCECNDLQGGAELLTFCSKSGYQAYGYLAPAFNPNNFNGRAENIWGDGKELALLLLPSEKVQQSLDKLRGYQVFPVARIDDLVLPLLFKPQYVPEVLEHTPGAALLGTRFPSPLTSELRTELEGAGQLMAQRYAEYVALEELARHRDADLQSLRAATAGATKVQEAMLRTAIRFEAEVARLNAHIALQNTRLEQARLDSERAAARLAKALAHIVDSEARAQTHIADVEARLRAVYASSSWRITRPLRGLAQRVRGGEPYDDTAFPPALAFAAGPTAVASDLESLGGTAPTIAAAPSLPSAPGLYAALANGSLRQPAVIFDHNGGGGSNAYSRGIISAMVAQGEMVLRVYCYEAQWFIQWVDGDQARLFTAISLEQLLDLLLATDTRNIVVNSVYGYMDVAAACRGIANLARSTGAALDFKVHDFLALCPSPHLSDFEQKYCGVPSDPSVCRDCLKVNNAWYHSWFPVENRPTEIKEWRKPFADLFDAATTITFFDASSVPILRKDFSFDDSKVRVVPHTNAYFRTAREVNIQGPLHIGVLGTLSHLKGGRAVAALQEYIEAQELPVPLTVVGQSYTPLSQKVTVYGSYATDDLPDIVERLGINVIFMATIVPETFSYTISEAMEMGLPIVAFDIGAQGKRLKDYVFGKVIPLGATPQMMLAAMESCLKTAQEMKK
jgi:FkbM family methyltransferase